MPTPVFTAAYKKSKTASRACRCSAHCSRSGSPRRTRCERHSATLPASMLTSSLSPTMTLVGFVLLHRRALIALLVHSLPARSRLRRALCASSDPRRRRSSTRFRAVRPDDPGSGPNFDALLKARLASAFVLNQQLEHFGVNVFPHIYMSNAAPLFMVGRDTVREWFRWATDARFLHQSQAPAARLPGHWNVRKLDEHDAPLTPAESLLVEALSLVTCRIRRPLLLLNATHAACRRRSAL